MNNAINLNAITDIDINGVAYYRDVDEAIGILQQRAGITDGGVAALVFSGFDWEKAWPGDRIEKIREWITLERAYLPVPPANRAVAMHGGKIAAAMEGAASAVERKVRAAPRNIMLYVWGSYDSTIIGPFASNDAAHDWAAKRFAGGNCDFAIYEPCRPEDYPSREDDGEKPVPFTFEQFQATKRVCADLGKAVSDSAWDERKTPATGLLYLGGLYIEDVDSEWTQDCRDRGRYHLLLERDEWISNDLLDLERKLYEFAISSGYDIDGCRSYYQDMPLILVCGVGRSTLTLREFMDAQEGGVDYAEEQAIVGALQTKGQYVGGGGAAATWILTKA